MAFNTLFSSILLQLCLASIGLAAPVSTEATDNSWQYGTGGGLAGLIVLILDIIVFGVCSPRWLRSVSSEVVSETKTWTKC